MGMNMHMSEVISDFIEPVVDTFEGGLEIISTEDMLARIDILNEKMKNWTPTSWWEGVTDGDFEACGKCEGMWVMCMTLNTQNIVSVNYPHPHPIHQTVQPIQMTLCLSQSLSVSVD